MRNFLLMVLSALFVVGTVYFAFRVTSSIARILAEALSTVLHAIAVLAGAVGISGLTGLLVGLAASFDADLDGVATGLLAACLMFFISLTVLVWFGRLGSEVADSPLPLGERWQHFRTRPATACVREFGKPGRTRGRSQEVATNWLGKAPASKDDSGLEDAWRLAGVHAEWARNRIGQSREACMRLIRRTEADNADWELIEWAAVIRARVPELVSTCLAECALDTSAERSVMLDELVDSLEQVGA